MRMGFARALLRQRRDGPYRLGRRDCIAADRAPRWAFITRGVRVQKERQSHRLARDVVPRFCPVWTCSGRLRFDASHPQSGQLRSDLAIHTWHPRWRYDADRGALAAILLESQVALATRRAEIAMP